MCHCPVSCGGGESVCRATTCIRQCVVEKYYDTEVNPATGSLEIRGEDLVNGCSFDNKLALYHPCVYSFQCASNYCSPDYRVCLADGSSATRDSFSSSNMETLRLQTRAEISGYATVYYLLKEGEDRDAGTYVSRRHRHLLRRSVLGRL